MAGYSWYDSLKSLKDVKVTIGATTYEVDEILTSMDSDGDFMRWTDELEVKFTMSDETEFSLYPVAFVAGDSTYSCVGDIDTEVVAYIHDSVQKDHALISDVKEILMDSLFEPSDDSEAEPYETQQRSFSRDMSAAVTKFVGGDMAAALVVMDQFICDTPDALRMPGYVWTIHFDGRAMTEANPFIRPGIVAINTAASEAKNHVVVMMSPQHGSDFCLPMSSKSEITPDRAEAYLRAEHDYDPDEDGFTLDSHGLTIDLDEWEAARPEEEA